MSGNKHQLISQLEVMMRKHCDGFTVRYMDMTGVYTIGFWVFYKTN